MACVLRVSGEDEDLGQLLRHSSFRVIAVFRKGETSPGRNVPSARSGCNIEVSCAEVGDLRRQISDALAFLDLHADELKSMSSKDGVEAILDFAVTGANVAVQNIKFPAELLQAIGNHRIALNVSMYHPSPST